VQLRAGVYARLSETYDAPESVPTQVTNGTRHAERRGWLVGATFRDDGYPAFEEIRRDDFVRLVEAIERVDSAGFVLRGMETLRAKQESAVKSVRVREGRTGRRVREAQRGPTCRRRPGAGAGPASTSTPPQGPHQGRGRTGKDTGIGRFPSHGFTFNQAWLTAAMTGQILLAWLKLIALDGDLATAEPRTLRSASCTLPLASCTAAADDDGRSPRTGPGSRRSPRPGSALPHYPNLADKYEPVLAIRRRTQGACGTPVPGPPAGSMSYPDAENPGHHHGQTGPQRQPSCRVNDQC
jgi:hypothetical protein